jgi:hypothetical protein
MIIVFPIGGKIMNLDKKRIGRFLLGAFIIVAFPNFTFLILDAYLYFVEHQHLVQTSYIVSTIAAIWSVGFKFTIDALNSKPKHPERIPLLVVFGFVFPIIFILIFQGIIPITITTEIVARAGFSAVFGFSVMVGYELMKK